jgi:predicted AAA+ superfamily ATPase
MKNYTRKAHYDELWGALYGDVNLIQAVIGPRQVGKTTLALQIFERWNGPKVYETADQPNTPSSEWIALQWDKIRKSCNGKKSRGLLILDEVQKIFNWSELVKKFFDEDRRFELDIRVILLGSSSLLMQRGLTESLAGRFELHRHYQWAFKECVDCFGLGLDEYIFFGGYPGALALRDDEVRWGRYIRDSLIETVLSKDILLLAPISKPVLLRQTFGLAVSYPAQIMSYQKMIGSLQDAGNTTTIASYIQLLSKAFFLTALERYSGTRFRQKGSIPKILVFDNGLVSAMAGRVFKDVKKDTMLWGRLVENAVGAQLYFLSQTMGAELFYWRERDAEVDFVLKTGQKVKAIEVKAGKEGNEFPALKRFARKYKNVEMVVVTTEKIADKGIDRNIMIEEFFDNPSGIL